MGRKKKERKDRWRKKEGMKEDGEAERKTETNKETHSDFKFQGLLC